MKTKMMYEPGTLCQGYQLRHMITGKVLGETKTRGAADRAQGKLLELYAVWPRSIEVRPFRKQQF